MKRCSTQSAIRKQQIKTIRHHHPLIRMAYKKETYTTRWWWGCRVTALLTHCWREQNGTSHFGKVWQILTKLHTQAYALVGSNKFLIYPNKMKTCPEMFIAALLLLTPTWKFKCASLELINCGMPHPLHATSLKVKRTSSWCIRLGWISSAPC